MIATASEYLGRCSFIRHAPPTLGSHNARTAISIPKVSRKYANTCVTPSP